MKIIKKNKSLINYREIMLMKTKSIRIKYIISLIIEPHCKGGLKIHTTLTIMIMKNLHQVQQVHLSETKLLFFLF
jgi:hypothetical protein